MADRRRFEAEVLVHLDAAYNLARWLVRAPADADDVVQDAILRAYRADAGRRGADARPWLLAIVRHAALRHLERRNRAQRREAGAEGEEALLGIAAPEADEPLAAALRAESQGSLAAALEALPPGFREVLVLRELEDLSYREIALVIDAPVGTVMSRLARARAALRACWQAERPEAGHGLR